jgi:Ser/Thr protein kinase RdoA (MazF antagonist)
VSPQSAREHVAQRIESQIEHAIGAEYINEDELATMRTACDLIPALEGEPPVPCHRDYCAANWLVDEEGAWAGVIDFEFAYWDVRVADFARDPHWYWILRPDLIEAFFEGYDRSLTPAEEQQLLVAHAEYALSAIVWGHENAFYGFEQEGRDSLAHLATLFK